VQQPDGEPPLLFLHAHIIHPESGHSTIDDVHRQGIAHRLDATFYIP